MTLRPEALTKGVLPHAAVLPMPSLAVWVVKATPRTPRWRVGCVAVLSVASLVVMATAPPAAAAREPTPGDFFEYAFVRNVGGGSGAYYGYTDETRSQGHYEVSHADGSQVTMLTGYKWTYKSSEGANTAGSTSRVVTFSLADRRYTSAQTDNDELDKFAPSNYSVWFWIPLDVRVGDRFRILEDNFEVVSLASTVWVGAVPVVAVQLFGSGYGDRSDAYGEYQTSWHEYYYFDRATGWLVADRYTEYDTGNYRGDWASFTWTENIDVTRTSYPIPVDYGALLVVAIEIAAVVAVLAAVAYAARWASRLVIVWGYGAVRIRRLRNIGSLKAPARGTGAPDDPFFAGQAADITAHFAEFRADIVRKALAAGDRVATASTGLGLVGMALYSRDGRIGTVFASDTGITEALRKFVGAKDFFTEWRHLVPATAVADAREMGVSISEKEAYNLLDTYEILKLDQIAPSAYDTTLVSRMTEGDLADVVAISERVYKIPSKRWIRSLYSTDDVGFVARADGKIVGFGFASFVNGAGRLHGATVLPDYRNRGIGRELLRARLNALYALGADYIIMEVARWNLASMALAAAHGFRPDGALFVETVRRRRVQRDIVRR